MDLDGVKAFLKVAELTSYTRAAAQLGLSKSQVSLRVQALETQLGSRLLQRSTRTVQLTSEGEQFVPRAQRLVSDAEELANMFSGPSDLKGRLRVDLPINLARDRVIPRLPEFFAAHPSLELELSTTDRRVDLLREGFDCVLRVGVLDDSALQVRRLGEFPNVNVASAAYLEKYGTPKRLDDLSSHYLVNYTSPRGTEPPAFEYREGSRYRDYPMKALISVNSADSYQAACVAGLGIIQIPRTAKVISSLVEVLPQFSARPLPISLVHAYGRTVPRRVRVFMDWLTRVLTPYLAEV
ncbi:MAG: LysR family transcriptional regulator [Archangium sp.]